MAGKCEQPALARNGSGENWGSKIGVILAVAGSAVGLGNFLRFPGLAAMNGGGVFMIPYFISMLLLGIPICWVEWTMGRYGGAHGYNSAPGIFSVLWRKSYGKYFGVLALLIPVVIYMYYVYVEAWCLSYAIDYATGKMAAVTDNATPDEEIQQYKDHFVNFVGKDQNGFPKGRVLIILAIVFFTNFFLIFRGLTKGIEIFCKFAMPLLIIFALIILVRVLTLGTPDPKQPENNINNALGFMWNPKVVAKYSWEQVSGPEVELSNTKAENPSFEAPVVTTPTNFKFQVKVSGGLKTEQTECEVALLPTSTKPQVNKGIIASPGEKIILGIDRSISTDIESQPFWTALADPQLWLVAAGQIFFSLSVGFGIVLNYASYLRKNDDVALSGLTASATNQFCEVCLGGLITVPVAFLFLGASGLNIETLGTSMALGFHALPAVFSRMPAGQFFGTLWFAMLFMAAITSSLSMLQPAIAFLEEGFGLGRRASVACLGFIVATGNLIVIYFSKGLLGQDTMDFWVGTVCIFILATIQVITVGWIFGIKNAKKEVQRGAELRIPNIFWFIIKYVSPIYLLTIFGFWCYNSIPKQIDGIKGLPDDDRQTVLFVLAFLVAVLAFFAMLVYLAGRRWNERQVWDQARKESRL
ncbi:MAG: SLC5/6 family protein [Planctomycetota bacterium]